MPLDHEARLTGKGFDIAIHGSGNESYVVPRVGDSFIGKRKYPCLMAGYWKARSSLAVMQDRAHVLRVYSIDRADQFGLASICDPGEISCEGIREMFWQINRNRLNGGEVVAAGVSGTEGLPASELSPSPPGGKLAFKY